MRYPKLVLLAALGFACASQKPHLADDARRLRDTGDLANANRLYAAALCKEAPSLDNARGLVDTWLALGKPGAVDQRLEHCKLPEHVRAYTSGLAAATAGDLTGAESLLAEAEAKAPDDDARAEVAYRRGLIALGESRFNDAITAFERARGFAPQRADVRLGLAQAHSRAGNHLACLETLRGILAVPLTADDIDHAHRILQTNVLAAELPLPDDIRAEVEELAEVAQRGIVTQQHVQRAKALNIPYRRARVLMVTGLLLVRSGDGAAGLAMFEEAGSAAPLNPDPLKFLGRAYFSANQPGMAFKPLRSAAERDPFDPELQGMLALAAIDQDDTEEALEAYRTLNILVPKDVESYRWVARIERKSGHLGAARIAAEKGLAIEPQDVQLLVERASILGEIAHAETDPVARKAAVGTTREALATLLRVSPGQPAAEEIGKSLEGL